MEGSGAPPFLTLINVYLFFIFYDDDGPFSGMIRGIDSTLLACQLPATRDVVLVPPAVSPAVSPPSVQLAAFLEI